MLESYSSAAPSEAAICKAEGGAASSDFAHLAHFAHLIQMRFLSRDLFEHTLHGRLQGRSAVGGNRSCCYQRTAGAA